MARVLIVEDHKELSHACRQFLQQDAHEVRLTTNASRATAMLADWQPDLMVIDIRLSDETSGLQLLRQITATHPGIRTILFSVFPVYKADFSSWVADRFIEKSEGLGALRRAIRELT